MNAPVQTGRPAEQVYRDATFSKATRDALAVMEAALRGMGHVVYADVVRDVVERWDVAEPSEFVLGARASLSERDVRAGLRLLHGEEAS